MKRSSRTESGRRHGHKAASGAESQTSKSAAEPENLLLSRRFWMIAAAAVALAVTVRFAVTGSRSTRESTPEGARETQAGDAHATIDYQVRKPFDASAFTHILARMKPWPSRASLDDVREVFTHLGQDSIRELEQVIASGNVPPDDLVGLRAIQATCWNYEGKPERAYELLTQIRTRVESDETLSANWLYTLIYLQGVTSLRRGENENCILCRGESSCILPVAPQAVHINPAGSRSAIRHFTEYLARFPDDLEVRWLLNLAHMTLGEHPAQVEPRFLISLDRWQRTEHSIGKFRDIGELVGVNRLNQSGGAIFDDVDNDGWPDLVVSTFDPTQPMSVYRNEVSGRFAEVSSKAGVTEQVGGGLYCVQADYDNDGWLDVFIPRGAWLPNPVRPTLLRNQGQGRFTDVTKQAGLLDALNSNSAAWGDFDNDGWLDLYVCCERQRSRLYRNLGNGTFADCAAKAGVAQLERSFCKGATWIDYDNDDDLDLFTNNLNDKSGHLFQNQGDGKFADVSASLGIDGPEAGFSCWTWDYDNDGYLDLFATSYRRTLRDVVTGLMGKPAGSTTSRLFHNRAGTRFEDATREAGLDMVFATMGSNFGDFDNDGFLDMYLGTGDPDVATLVPNRMFKNLAGRTFAEITSSSGTGHLQKGHSVACADWDRDGDLDIFIQMGGAIPGDRYHNILFQNPGQQSHWLSVKLVGQKTNRSAIGARIKLTTAGDAPATLHRCVSTGSSFGANSLEQHLGLGQATRVATLEVHWPTSGTTQVFRDIAADQAIEITEFADDFKQLDYSPIKAPDAASARN
jgi:hypothetical protein